MRPSLENTDTFIYSLMWENFFLAFLIIKLKDFNRCKGGEPGRKMYLPGSEIGLEGPPTLASEGPPFHVFCPLLAGPHTTRLFLFFLFTSLCFGFLICGMGLARLVFQEWTWHEISMQALLLLSLPSTSRYHALLLLEVAKFWIC